MKKLHRISSCGVSFYNVYAMKILFVDREACYDICIEFLDSKCIHR